MAAWLREAHGYVAMWLCGYVDVWLCGNVVTVTHVCVEQRDERPVI